MKFRFLDWGMSKPWARSVHMITGYLGFLLTAFHVGLHFSVFMGMLRRAFGITKRNIVRTWVMRLLAATISCYGLYALIARDFIDYITLRTHFVFFNYEEAIIFYILILFQFQLLQYY